MPCSPTSYIPTELLSEELGLAATRWNLDKGTCLTVSSVTASALSTIGHAIWLAHGMRAGWYSGKEAGGGTMPGKAVLVARS